MKHQIVVDEYPMFPRLVGPTDYPTMCTPELTRDIVELIDAGTSAPTAAQACGVMSQRFHQWMKWGQDAYLCESQEAGQQRYLQFYLDISQASGRTRAVAEQYAFRARPDFWLSHEPEARRTWGDTSDMPADVAPAPEINTREAAPLYIEPPKQDLSAVLRTLLEAGALTYNAAPTNGSDANVPPQVVDAAETEISDDDLAEAERRGA